MDLDLLEDPEARQEKLMGYAQDAAKDAALDAAQDQIKNDNVNAVIDMARDGEVDMKAVNNMGKDLNKMG